MEPSPGHGGVRPLRASRLQPRARVSDAWRDHEAMSKHGHYSEQEFERLVSSALDELPIEFQRALEHVAIVVSDRGAENHAYGTYVGSRSGGVPFFGGGGFSGRDPDFPRHART